MQKYIFFITLYIKMNNKLKIFYQNIADFHPDNV